MPGDDFTTIAAMLTGPEAAMARELLAAEGIDAIVQGGTVSSMEPFAPGFGASLLVRRSDEARARELLAETGVLETLRRGERP